jgi:hypothetical protein
MKFRRSRWERLVRSGDYYEVPQHIVRKTHVRGSVLIAWAMQGQIHGAREIIGFGEDEEMLFKMLSDVETSRLISDPTSAEFVAQCVMRDGRALGILVQVEPEGIVLSQA